MLQLSERGHSPMQKLFWARYSDNENSSKTLGVPYFLYNTETNTQKIISFEYWMNVNCKTYSCIQWGNHVRCLEFLIFFIFKTYKSKLKSPICPMHKTILYITLVRETLFCSLPFFSNKNQIGTKKLVFYRTSWKLSKKQVFKISTFR